jgi:hypothetical protein
MISALLELQYCDPQRASELNCKKCPEKVRRMRRCDEDKWDFDSTDASFFPMRVTQGHGELYGFCPAKATWDNRVISLYRALVLSAETGAQWQNGGISSQPDWWVDLASWFIPSYNELRFAHRARMILGDGKKSNGARKRTA